MHTDEGFNCDDTCVAGVNEVLTTADCKDKVIPDEDKTIGEQFQHVGMMCDPCLGPFAKFGDEEHANCMAGDVCAETCRSLLSEVYGACTAQSTFTWEGSL